MAQNDSQSMHYASLGRVTTRGVPRFLLSLYEIVTDKNSDDLVRWSLDGNSFFILERDRFAREVLGKWFKTNHYTSFVRQLNNYGIRKVPHLKQGALRPNSAAEHDHFAHSKFRRDQRDLLAHIQRKGQAAPNHPVQPIVVDDSSQPVSMPESVAAGDDSREQLLERILLEVDTLKCRQEELDKENRSLHDALETMGLRVQFLMRFLANLGFNPMAGHQWMRGNEQLMIQGVPGKVEVGEAMDSRRLSDWSDSSSSHGQAHLSESNRPISTDKASPPASRPSLVRGPYESTGHTESDPGSIDIFSLSSGGASSGQSYQTQHPRGDLTDSLNPSDPLHLSMETDSYWLDARNVLFVDPPMENLNGYNQIDCVGENDRSFHHIPSPFSGYSNEAVTGSDVPTSSGILGTYPPLIDPTNPIADVTGQKRKATATDELEYAEPQRTPTHPSLFSSDARSAIQFIYSTSSLLPTIPSSMVNDTRPTKRAKRTLELNGDYPV